MANPEVLESKMIAHEDRAAFINTLLDMMEISKAGPKVKTGEEILAAWAREKEEEEEEKASVYADPNVILDRITARSENVATYDKVFIPAGTRAAYIERWHRDNDTLPAYEDANGNRYIPKPREMPEIIELDAFSPEVAADTMDTPD
jgi:hypothetical protein